MMFLKQLKQIKKSMKALDAIDACTENLRIANHNQEQYQDEIIRLKKALLFYADHETWNQSVIISRTEHGVTFPSGFKPIPANEDQGKIAKRALENG